MSPDNACASMLLCSLGKQLFFRGFFFCMVGKRNFSLLLIIKTTSEFCCVCHKMSQDSKAVVPHQVLLIFQYRKIILVNISSP